jgi:NAD(P)-dependent dehydrogenase (short-subunit alcohol dehydrogenase family)
MRLKDRVAVVTAAGSGMGRASSVRFAAEGAHVVVVDWDGAAADETVEQIENQGGSARAAVVDVTDLAALQELFAEVDREHGKLHVLYNNAGTPGPEGIDIPLEEYDRTVNLNFRSALYATHFAESSLKKADGKASVIFTSSTSGLVGSPLGVLYSAMKGAVVLLMKSLALRFGTEGVRVNAICPGVTQTPMLQEFFGRGQVAVDIDAKVDAFLQQTVPMGRVALPEEIAAVAAFLASDDASYVHGVALPVDGGLTAK